MTNTFPIEGAVSQALLNASADAGAAAAFVNRWATPQSLATALRKIATAQSELEAARAGLISVIEEMEEGRG